MNGGLIIICKTLLKGGAEKQALTLAKSLSERGIEVCFVNLFGNRADPENIDFISRNSINYLPMEGSLPRKISKLIRFNSKRKTSVIISYLTHANFVTGLCKIADNRIKAIGGIRNEKLPFFKFLIEKAIHNYLNDITIFNNFSAREKFIKKGFNPVKITVIQNAIDSENVPERRKVGEDGEIRIISVGRFVKQKDYPTALNSFKLLISRDRNIKYRYTIVGYGPLEGYVRNLAKDMGLSDCVNLLINPPDIQKILAESDIFLSTSLFEGVSNSIMEAMLAELPVVVTDVGDNKYLVKDGFNGFLIPCKSASSVAEKLEFLAESESMRREFGRNSRSVIERNFSREQFTKKYLRLLSEIESGSSSYSELSGNL